MLSNRIKGCRVLKDILTRLNVFFCGRLENKQVIYLTVYFAIISILELIVFSTNITFASELASRIWLIGGAFLLLSIIYYFVSSVKIDIIHKNIISLTGIIGLLIYLLYLCGDLNYSDINPDATQQIAAGLDSFGVRDLNYTDKAFLGYPNKQYVLIAIPALLFGRSIFTLHVGFALPFILGMMAFYSGLNQWSYNKGLRGNYIIIAPLSIFAFRYVTEYYFMYEQAILPISLTMLLIGLFLNLLCKPNALCIISIAWVGCLCSNSYTPALATLGLLLVFVVLLAVTLLIAPDRLPFAIKNRIQTVKLLYAMEANILIFFIATLIGNRSDRVSEIRMPNNIFAFAGKSIYNFLTDQDAVFMGFMGIIVLIYIVASLARLLKIHDFLLSLWVLGVFVATNLMIGYTAYDEIWIMQRAMVVVPVLITGMSLAFIDFIQKHNIPVKKQAILVVAVVFCIVAKNNMLQINQSFNYFNCVQPMKYLLSDLESTSEEFGLSHMDTFNFVIYTNNGLIKNPEDYFIFLYPNAISYIGEYGQFPDNVDLTKPTIIYSDEELTDILPSYDYELVEYENQKHAVSGAWYKICIMN